MKKYYVIFISMFFVTVANAQTLTKIKQKRNEIILKGDLPVDKNATTTSTQIARKQMIISSNPIPKADPAREERAKRKQPGTIKEFGTN